MHIQNITIYLFFVAGSLGKHLICPAQLVCWVLHVCCQFVLVIVEVSVQHQHPVTFPAHQFFCVISSCASQQTPTQLYFVFTFVSIIKSFQN